MGLAEINGRPATAGDLAVLAFAGYGHFTSMQLRDHRVRGYDLHLVRLRENSRELFGWAVEDDRVRGYLRRVLRAGPADASVQVNVFSGDGAAVESGRPVDPDVLVRAGPPATAGTTPVRVRTTRYQRLLPHIKHVATLGLVHHWRLARQAGFEDVLFVDPDGFVSEGSIWKRGLL
jgi:branched-subunit amino acid aminotransferase/4-amino-4-deoxychorismate lyase